MALLRVILACFRPDLLLLGSKQLQVLQDGVEQRKWLSVIGSPFSDSIGRSVLALRPVFVPELGALFLLSKSRKVRVEERRKGQRRELSPSRERSERLDSALSRSNGLSGERVHDLERSTANRISKRSALFSQANIRNVHPVANRRPRDRLYRFVEDNSSRIAF